MVLGLAVLIFAFSLWLGLYLINRGPRKPRLLYTGLGLVAYALAVAADSLSALSVDPAISASLRQLGHALIFLPAVFWAAASYSLQDTPATFRYFDLSVWIMAGLFLLMGAAGGVAYIVADILATLLLIAALALAWRAAREVRSPRRAGLLITAVLFFTLTMGLIMLQLEWLPRDLLLFALGLDFLFLGFAIAALDALDEGEALLPDALGSMLISAFAALLVGGLIVLTIALVGEVTLPTASLLFAAIASAILLQMFNGALQGLADRLVLRSQPGVAQARTQLRATAEALPRRDPTLDPLTLDEGEFARLTRRALSHMSDLPRLAASPLTKLPVVEARLAKRGVAPDSLTRAAELKALLAECISKLRPSSIDNFGTTGQWRHYNALYFPYVAGLRPYSQNHHADQLGEAERAALVWFRTEVPERTLHNWQNAAAKLIAQQLQDMNRG